MTQFNKRKGYEELLEQLKSLSLKIQEATSKSVAVTEKKVKRFVRHINQPGAFTYKSYPDEPVVIRCDVPVVENTFVDDCK